MELKQEIKFSGAGEMQVKRYGWRITRHP